MKNTQELIMNERIRQLALQAGFQYVTDEGIGWCGNHNASLPKFAELIIRDIITVVAAQALLNESALDVFKNLKTIYEDVQS